MMSERFCTYTRFKPRLSFGHAVLLGFVLLTVLLLACFRFLLLPRFEYAMLMPPQPASYDHKSADISRRVSSVEDPFARIRSYKTVATNFSTAKNDPIPPLQSSCPKVAIVTAASAPSSLTTVLTALAHWYIIVVPTCPDNHNSWTAYARAHPNVTFLSPEFQASLPFSTVAYLSPYHPSRKSVAYLYAMHLSASVIWDTDEHTNPMPFKDPIKDSITLAKLSEAALSPRSFRPLAQPSHQFANPYPHFIPVNTNTARTAVPLWPRGLPHAYASSSAASNLSTSGETVPESVIAVYQTLTDDHADSDVLQDSLYASRVSFLLKNTAIALPTTRFLPINSHATLWRSTAFQQMLLPASVSPYMADVMRGFLAHPILAQRGLFTAVVSPFAVRTSPSDQASLVHNAQQLHLIHRLVDWLRQWQPSGKSPMHELYVDLYEIGVIDESDVRLCEAWLQDVARLGFEPATDANSKPMPVPPNASDSEVIERRHVNGANVAVCVSGQVRTLNMSVDSPLHSRGWYGMKNVTLPPPNMTVAESIQRVLYPKLGGSPDVFMVVSTRETEREPRVGDLSVCEPLRPPAPGHLSCEVPREVEEPLTDLEGLWESFMLYYQSKPSERLMIAQGFLQQLKGMYECHRTIRKHSIATGKVYDWIVRVRPDNYMARMPDLGEFVRDARRKPTVWYGSFGVCCCGNKDRFGIAPARLMEPYLDRFLYFQKLNWTMKGIWDKKKQRTAFSAERFLDSVLSDHGIALRMHPNIHVCTVKPADRKTRSQP